MSKDTLPLLRQALDSKLHDLRTLLKPAFELDALLPGVVTCSKHRCGNPGCACARQGKLHEAVRLLIKFKDGYATRSLSESEVRSFKPRADAYRRLRKARSDFGKWSKAVIELIDRIERGRRSLDGLSEEDRKRPLR